MMLFDSADAAEVYEDVATDIWFSIERFGRPDMEYNGMGVWLVDGDHRKGVIDTRSPEYQK